MSTSGPARWSTGAADAPQKLRELLVEARSDLPSPAELGRVSAKLGGLLDLSVSVPTTAVSTPTSVLGKWIGMTAAAGAIAGGVAYGIHDARTPSGHVAPPAVTSTHVVDTPPAAVTAREQRTTDAATEDDVAPPAATPPVSKGVKPPSEVELLDRARAALKTEPAKALALTRQHQRLYPDGALSQEREVLAIEALSRLGKKGNAEKRAGQFEQRYPGSAYQKKVETTVRDSGP
jgi:hypothetical protein